jgi:hypothetical protein
MADFQHLFEDVVLYRSSSIEDFKVVVDRWLISPKVHRRALAMHCLLNLYETVEDCVIKKCAMYDDTKLYFERHYSDPMVGVAEMGKLVKTVFKCPTRRVGSKTGAKYCYVNVRMQRDKVRWFEKQSVKEKATYIDDTIRFKIIVHPRISQLDDMFEQFLYDQKFTQETDSKDPRLKVVSSMLLKSDLLLDNFHNSIERGDVMGSMLMDWYNLDIISLVKDTLSLNDDALTLISTFPMVLDPTYEAANVSDKDLLLKYYKIRCDHTKVNNQKIKMIQFMIELFLQFDNCSFTKFSLNFKFVATTVLRHLSMEHKTSFGSYWMLYCFLDEFMQFMLEFYCFKKNEVFMASR